MDEMVVAAMAKWPNVPDCYGWLGLDGRGQWYLRDIEAQKAGPFAGAGANAKSRGNRLEHAGLIAFIGRNYASDANGQWFSRMGRSASTWSWSGHLGCGDCQHRANCRAIPVYRSNSVAHGWMRPDTCTLKPTWVQV